MIRKLCFLAAFYLSAGSIDLLAAIPENSGVLELDRAVQNDLTLYGDKALIRQRFNVQPDSNGMVSVEGIGSNWRGDSLELEYTGGDKPVLPTKISWTKGRLDRDSLYSKLVGKTVELVGGGLNVPVQGELLVYDDGVALVQGHNGRQYVVDWNDSQGVRLASKEPVFTEKDYIARLTADFGRQPTLEPLRLSYLTPALKYSSEYRLIQEAQGRARLERYITLINDSAIDYRDATIRMVAGGRESMVAYSRQRGGSSDGVAASARRGEQRVGELLVTRWPEPVSVNRHSRVQLPQYKQAIRFEKLYTLDVQGRSYGGRSSSLERPRLVLAFKAGIDLAAGRVAIYEQEQSGATLLGGEAWLSATLKGDPAQLVMGEALAVRVERYKTDSQQKGDALQILWQATVYNDRNETIAFRLSDQDRSLLKLSDVKGGSLENTDAIRVSVPPASQKTLTYMATYSR